MNPYTEQVKRGRALLDKERPGWREEIDLSQLELSLGCLCVLGQVFGHYNSGVFALWNVNPDAYNDDVWVASDAFQAAVAHGFTIPFDGKGNEADEWQALQEAWIAELSTQNQGE